MKKKQRLQRSDWLWLTAVALLVLLQFWWLPGDPGRPDDTYSNTIEGKRGFFQTLKGLSDAELLPPVRRETRILIPDEICTLVILGPDLYPNEYEQRELSEFVMNGGSLVFAPSWSEPTCLIPQLSIRTSHGLDGEATTVTAPAVPATGAGSTSTSGSTSNMNTSVESDGLPAEADDFTVEGSGASIAPPGAEANTAADGSSRNSVASSGTTKSAETSSDRSSIEKADDLVDRAKRSAPGTVPAAPPNVELEGPDNFRDVFDLNTSSQLVEGSVKWRTRATLHTESLKPTVLVETASKKTQAAAWRYGNGLVLASASADVFSNRAMLDEGQAELAVRLIEFAHANHNEAALTTPIVVSEFLNTRDSYRGTSVLLSPSLRSGTLQLLTVAVLAGWLGFHRFGPAKRDNRFRRRSLTESASAIGNLYFRTQSGAEVVHSYLEYVKSHLQRMFGNGVRIDSSQAIATRTGLEANEVKRRVDNAIRLSGTKSTSAAQAASAVRDLSEILGRLTGTRQKNA